MCRYFTSSRWLQMPEQAKLSDCLGSLSLHLGSRFSSWLNSGVHNGGNSWGSHSGGHSGGHGGGHSGGHSGGAHGAGAGQLPPCDASTEGYDALLGLPEFPAAEPSTLRLWAPAIVPHLLLPSLRHHLSPHVSEAGGRGRHAVHSAWSGGAHGALGGALGVLLGCAALVLSRRRRRKVSGR